MDTFGFVVDSEEWKAFKARICELERKSVSRSWVVDRFVKNERRFENLEERTDRALRWIEEHCDRKFHIRGSADIERFEQRIKKLELETHNHLIPRVDSWNTTCTCYIHKPCQVHPEPKTCGTCTWFRYSGTQCWRFHEGGDFVQRKASGLACDKHEEEE